MALPTTPPRAPTIRPVHADEYERLGELTVTAYRAWPGSRVSGAYERELRDVAARAARVPVLVAVAGDDLVGGVTYVPGPGPYAERERPGEAGFRMLAVDPAARGRGVGRALVEHCVARARVEHRRALVLLTTPWMTGAHRLYERLGFRRAPDRDWEPESGLHLRCYLLDLTTG